VLRGGWTPSFRAVAGVFATDVRYNRMAFSPTARLGRRVVSRPGGSCCSV